MTGRTRAALVPALALAFALTGCAGLPTSGPVNPGLGRNDAPDVPEFTFSPDEPQPGATPEQIVQGFVAAATGSADDWRVARLFLAPELSETWNPESGVTIDRPGSRDVTLLDDDTVQLSVVAEANVGETGAYEIADRATTALTYDLQQQSDGEWRIAAAPDGLVLDEDSFEGVFRAYSLMYFDPSWNFLVPDVRWFATRNPATRITRALLAGSPSPWLEGSVVSAAPDGVSLTRQSVPVLQGVAQVELTDAALGADPVTLGRLQRQLEASLQGAGIAAVDLLVDGAEVAVSAAPVLSTAIDARPLALTEDGFGFLSSGELTTVPGLGPTIEALGVVSVAMGRGERVAAAELGAGGVVRIEASGLVSTADTRADLIDPVIDPDHVIWTVPAGEPAALRATAAEGGSHDVADAWPSATRITSMQISRDGTRLAALITEGGRDWAVVSGILRNDDGTPTALGETQRVVSLGGGGVDVAWLDDRTLGIVTGDEGGNGGAPSIVREHVVGGTGRAGTGPAAPITAMAAGATVTSARALTAERTLYLRRSTTWQQAAEGVVVLASQLGSG